jgi:hypothetical protein
MSLAQDGDEGNGIRIIIQSPIAPLLPMFLKSWGIRL